MFKRKNKYNARKCVIAGETFDSMGEGKRYQVLKLLERAGRIRNLMLKPPALKLAVNGVKVCEYRPDFSYTDGTGAVIYEDFKGVETAVFKLKKKLAKSLGYEIKITTEKDNKINGL